MMLIIELLVSLFQSILCVSFILAFNGSSWRKCRLSFLTVVILFAVTVAGDYFFPGFNTEVTLILFIISTLFAMSLPETKFSMALLSSSIYKISVILISTFIYTAMSLLFDNFNSLLQGSDGLGRFLYIICGNILLWGVLKLILAIFIAKIAIDKWIGIIAFCMSLSTVIGLGIVISLTTVTLADSIKGQILGLTIIFVFTNVVLYFLIYQIQKLQQNKYNLERMNEKLKFDENRYNDAAVIWNNIRRVQHDIKQHLTVINCQLEDGQFEECKNYVHDLIPTTDRMGNLIKSNNAILDYIINSKLCGLEKTQIVISGSVGNLSDIRDLDLACLMGNILDNAIEAVAELEEKRIELQFAMQNENRIILCRNTIVESVLEKNRELCSTKKGEGAHGYGHIIVERIVKSYHGIVDYYEEDGMFAVQVILPAND